MKNNKHNKWMALLTIPFQMGVVIFSGVFLGRYLDEKFSVAPLFIVVLSLIAIGIALYHVINQIKSIQKEKNDE